MRVFVTGATGYIGQPLVHALRAIGHTVVALQRPGTRRPLPSGDGVVPFVADLFDVRALAEAMQGADALVHLVGIIRERPARGETMRRVHVEGTRAVMEAACQAGVRRVCHMSALGARLDAPTAYHRTKWEAEKVVRQSGLPYTIYRPSVVFGRGGPGQNFVQQLRDLVRVSPIVPLIGDGLFRLQPVAIEAVVAAFRAGVEEARGQSYELGGPQVWTYADVLRTVASAMGLHRRFVPIPVPVIKAAVRAGQRFPGFPITMDQLNMLLSENVCADAERAVRDLNLPSIPFSVL
jgi:uncharacterized protein YbjT (DUF2867 family)